MAQIKLQIAESIPSGSVDVENSMWHVISSVSALTDQSANPKTVQLTGLVGWQFSAKLLNQHLSRDGICEMGRAALESCVDNSSNVPRYSLAFSPTKR